MRRLLPLLLLALPACMPEPPEVDGALAFAEDCSACHGAGGQGGGPLAQGLDPAPPDLTGIAARNGGVFPRDRVMSVIDGFSRGAHFSPAMPEFGAGDLGPTVIVEGPDGTGTPIPARLLALADYLESIQAP
jgi:hypothetical protein